jgi:hypothetical protein
MSRSLKILIISLVALMAFSLCACMVAWMGFMSYVNTRTVALTVEISDGVDSVRIFRTTDPENPVAFVEAGGQNMTAVVSLARSASFSPFYQTRPAQYFFEVEKGGQRVVGAVACSNGAQAINRIHLRIVGIEQAEIVSQ